MTLKSRAEFYPQTTCQFFKEYEKNFDCRALTECWCCLEKKPCNFYKSKRGVPQEAHKDWHYESGKKQITEEEFQKIKTYHFGRSWAKAAEKYGCTVKQVWLARQKYDPDGDKGATPRPKIPDDVLVKALRMRKDGMNWQTVGEKLGYSGATIAKRLKNDAERGITYDSED
jgi:hypothetical protein